jgi:hypothetical protein
VVAGGIGGSHFKLKELPMSAFIYAQEYSWKDGRLHLSWASKEIAADTLDEAAELSWGKGLKTAGNPQNLVGKIWRVRGMKPEEKRYYRA